MGRVRSFQKLAQLVGRLSSGLCLVGQIGSAEHDQCQFSVIINTHVVETRKEADLAERDVRIADLLQQMFAVDAVEPMSGVDAVHATHSADAAETTAPLVYMT